MLTKTQFFFFLYIYILLFYAFIYTVTAIDKKLRTAREGMAGSKGLQIVIEPCCGRNSGLVHETHTLPGELLQSALVPSGRYQWLSDFWKDVSVISKILNVILN